MDLYIDFYENGKVQSIAISVDMIMQIILFMIMIDREYVIHEITSNKKIISIICKYDNAETLNSFLNTDVRAFEDWIKKDFDLVIAGEQETNVIDGNACHVEISPTTKIYDLFAEEDEEYYGTRCEVDTKELRLLIDEWCNKIKQFKEGK